MASCNRRRRIALCNRRSLDGRRIRACIRFVATKAGRRARPHKPVSLSHCGAREKQTIGSGYTSAARLGRESRVFPLDEYGRPLKETLPRAKLLVMKQAGHGAYLDKPDEFNELLLDFLSEVM